MMRVRNFQVGLFTLCGLAILAVFTIYLRSWDFLSNRVSYFVTFERVNRLDVGAPVLAKGIQVGDVAEMELVGGRRPVVRIRIKRDVLLYPDAEVRVTAAPVIGDTTVNIDPGNPGPGKEALPPGSEIKGITVSGVEELAGEVSEELKNTLQAMNRLLNDPENQANVKRMMANIANASERLNQTFGMVNDQFEPTLRDLQLTARNLNRFIDSATSFTQQASTDLSDAKTHINAAVSAWGQDAQVLSTQIEQTSIHLRQATDNVQNLLMQNQPAVKEIMDSLRESTVNLNKILEAIQSGKGTLGRLVNDPRPFEELRSVTRSLNQRLNGASEPNFNLDTTPKTPRTEGPQP